MGKTKIVTKQENAEGVKTAPSVSVSKKRVDVGMLMIQSTYNNTIVTLSDNKGNALGQSSSGSIGFKGAKKGTPFAAAKIGEFLGTKAQAMGMKQISVVIKGVGSGRESALRGFIGKGNFEVLSIKDATPVPHNGPRPPKPRRV
jgi:small subunit ribosomal protein S11